MAPKKSRTGKEIGSSGDEIPNFGLREDEYVHKDLLLTLNIVELGVCYLRNLLVLILLRICI